MSLVRAMEAGAQCVLLDEPFTGLDEENRKKAEDYIRRTDERPDRDDSYSYQNRRRIFGNDADADIETTGGRPIMEKGTENTRVTLIGIIVEDPEAADKDQRTFTRIWGIYHRQNGDTLS